MDIRTKYHIGQRLMATILNTKMEVMVKCVHVTVKESGDMDIRYTVKLGAERLITTILTEKELE